jgi:hypothetical protein
MSREEDVQEWLAYAEADRRSAHNAMKMQDYRDAALHCQQAVRSFSRLSSSPRRVSDHHTSTIYGHC